MRFFPHSNGWVVANNVNNYTKDHNYIWDEIAISLDYKSDAKYTQEKFMNIVTLQTSQFVEKAKKSIESMGEKYYLGEANAEPVIFTTLTDKEISLKIRYTVETRQRGIIKDKISNLILEEIKKHRIGLDVSPTLNSSEILRACPNTFVDHLLGFLKEDEFPIEEVKSFTKTLVYNL